MQNLAAQALGQDPRQPRLSVGQIGGQGAEHDISVMPVDAAGWTPLQNPVTGEFYFMFGVDPLA
jgi:hypothetical protein